MRCGEKKYFHRSLHDALQKRQKIQVWEHLDDVENFTAALLESIDEPPRVESDPGLLGTSQQILRTRCEGAHSHVEAQAIRVILLASAMAATLVGRRAQERREPGRCWVPWILTWRMTASAPATKQAAQIAVTLFADIAEPVLASTRVLL
jgi:hypothetical protein